MRTILFIAVILAGCNSTIVCRNTETGEIGEYTVRGLPRNCVQRFPEPIEDITDDEYREFRQNNLRS